MKTQLKKHTIEQKKKNHVGGEGGSAGIANESKPLVPSRREEKGKELRKEKPRIARRDKKNKRNFSSSQNLQILYLQRQKKPRGTGN